MDMDTTLSRRDLLAAALTLPLTSRLPTASEWKAGAARVKITPTKSLWQAGYAARMKPSEGVLTDLYAKALALQDRKGQRAVLVTTDLLGLPQSVSRNVARRVKAEYNITRDRLCLTSSHTHGGPVVGDTLRVAYGMTDAQWADVRDYTRWLEDRLVEVIGAALKDLTPASVSFGHGRAAFAINRRLRRDPNAPPSLEPDPTGPVDHDVPFLRIDDEAGRLRAVVFCYACHNTTLGGDAYRFHGDYAGFAQEWLETQYPGAVAMFISGCGGDANPNPRGRVEHARQHGESLGRAVNVALTRAKPIGGPLRTAYSEVTLEFAKPAGRDEWKAKLNDQNVYVRRHAKMMLDELDRTGRIHDTYPYPVQVWQFARDVTLIPLAGEVVVDYALRLEKELGADDTWVAGYANDVFAYIPSVRILQEGGYEGGGAMLYYGHPGPFAPTVEEIIVRKVHELVRRTNG
jgi:neutral ceramidase